jgi:formylmethanofuran dehydrogenase subunit D
VFQCPESLAGNVQEGDAVHITTDSGTVLFDGEVSKIEPDGMGWIVLNLQEMS